MTPIEQVREALEAGRSRCIKKELHLFDAAIAILKDMEDQEWPLTLGDRYMNPAGASVVLRNPPAHPSPSAPVDIAEVIAAGDSLHKRLGSDIDYLTMSAKAEAMAERDHWTEATAKHRTT